MRKQLWLFLLGLFGICSCIDVIDYERPQTFADAPVIQSTLILDEISTVFVDLSSVFDKNGFINPPRIPNADVSLWSVDGQSKIIPLTRVGYFYTEILPDDPDITISEGEQYFVRVVWDGDVFESMPETMPPKTQISKLHVAPTVTSYISRRLESEFFVDQLEFSVDTELKVPGTETAANVLIEFSEAVQCFPGCYREQVFSPRTKIIFNGDDFEGQRVSRHPMFKMQLTSKFKHGYYLTAHQYTLTKTAYEYFASINGSLGFTGNGFEAAPGKVITNMHCVSNPSREALGYFYASQASMTRLYVAPSFYNEDSTPLEIEVFGCKQCVNEKPEYWIE